MSLLYLDASAIVKLIRAEPETPSLRKFIGDADLVASQLVVAEVPRAIRRAVESDPQLPLESLLGQARAVLAAIALHRLDRAVLAAAGAISEPLLRTLDAVHVVAAVDLAPLDAFVTYDERQAAAARLAGLRTAQPGS